MMASMACFDSCLMAGLSAALVVTEKDGMYQYPMKATTDVQAGK